MNQAIVIRNPKAATIPEPKVPEALEAAITTYLRADMGTFEHAGARLNPGVVNYLDTLVAGFDAAIRAAITEEDLTDWLVPFCDSVAKPPSEEAFSARIRDVLATAPNLPRCALNDRSKAALVRTFTWFPSSKELIEFLEAQGWLLIRRRTALQAIRDGVASRATEPPKPRVEPTEVEKVQVSQAVHGLVRELAARRVPRSGDDGEDGGSRPEKVIKRTRTDDMALLRGLQEEARTADPRRRAFLAGRIEALEKRINEGGY